MWPYILFAVAATALGTTVEVLYYGSLYNSSRMVLAGSCDAIGNTSSWSVNGGDTMSINFWDLHNVIFRIYKNMTLFISPVISKEYQGEYHLLSLLFLIFDAFSEPSELTCSNSSGHSATVNSGIRAASPLVNSSTLMFFQHLFSSLPELGGGNLFMHGFIGGVNGDSLHF